MSRDGGAVKTKRQQAIRSIVARDRLSSQAAIRSRLARIGLEATQSTISRDIEELGLARVHDRSGVHYVLPVQDAPSATSVPSAILQRALREFALSFHRGAGGLLLIRTPSGAAPALGEAIDLADLPKIAGTIAGDNTLLVVPREGVTARTIERALSAAIGS
jgi:transcriptional regulator of arginine metabolism